MSYDSEAPQSTNDPADLEGLLAATNARRAARGRDPLTLADFEAPPDDALRAEIRAFVESRNARRVARGLEPLDVEAEVERRLSGPDGEPPPHARPAPLRRRRDPHPSRHPLQPPDRDRRGPRRLPPRRPPAHPGRRERRGPG